MHEHDPHDHLFHMNEHSQDSDFFLSVLGFKSEK